MKRILLPALVVFVFCGCCASRQPPVDPFYGRTTVPPPGTGAVCPQPVPRTTRGRRRPGRQCCRRHRSRRPAAWPRLSSGPPAICPIPPVRSRPRSDGLSWESRPPTPGPAGYPANPGPVPTPGPAGYPGNPAGGGAPYPGNSNGAVPYPSSGGATPYPSGGGASTNSPSRSATVWTGAPPARRATLSGFPPPAGRRRTVLAERSRSVSVQASCRPHRIIGLLSFRIASAGNPRRGQHFRHDSGARSRRSPRGQTAGGWPAGRR